MSTQNGPVTSLQSAERLIELHSITKVRGYFLCTFRSQFQNTRKRTEQPIHTCTVYRTTKQTQHYVREVDTVSALCLHMIYSACFRHLSLTLLSAVYRPIRRTSLSHVLEKNFFCIYVETTDMQTRADRIHCMNKKACRRRVPT